MHFLLFDNDDIHKVEEMNDEQCSQKHSSCLSVYVVWLISENYEQSLSQSLKQAGILTLLVSTSETPRCSVYNNTEREANGSVDMSLINEWHKRPVIIFLVNQVINRLFKH